MSARLYAVLEYPPEAAADDASGESLAWVVEMHPDLMPLLDFCIVEPLQVAREIGMFHPSEEDAEDDFADLDTGPLDWYEPAAGISAVRHALAALRADPASIAKVLYEPGLKQEAVIADLETIELFLCAAIEHETRFHFVMAGEPGRRPKRGR